jgi:hypothetical protein
MAIPLPSEVLFGVSFTDSDGAVQTGSLVIPTPVFPSPADVRFGVDNGAGVAGTLAVPTVFPSADDVRLGIDNGAGVTGKLTVPPANKVLEGFKYDTNLSVTGALALTGDGLVADDLPSVNKVLSGVLFGRNNTLVGKLDPDNYNKTL